MTRPWPLYVAMAVAGAAAVVASAFTLASLARAGGWAGQTPWLLPAALDVGGCAGGWCWLRPDIPTPARRFGRAVALTGVAGTVLGNGVGHLVASGYLTPGPVLVVVVGAVPAAVLAALAHLAALLTAAEPSAASAAESSSPVASSPAPGDTETTVPGDGGETPPAAPPRGRSTKTRKGSGKPSREAAAAAGRAAAAAYIDAERVAGRTPTQAGMVAAMRSRTGSGKRAADAAVMFRELYPEGSRSPLRIVPGASPDDAPGALPEGSREGANA